MSENYYISSLLVLLAAEKNEKEKEKMISEIEKAAKNGVTAGPGGYLGFIAKEDMNEKSNSGG